MILATTIDGGIGFDDKIPWHIKEELGKFKKITSDVDFNYKQNAIIMGIKTWNSLAKKPLPNRLNIVLTSNKNWNSEYSNVLAFNKLENALYYCMRLKFINNIYIIGGATLYNTILNNEYYLKLVQKIFLSIMFYDSKHESNKFVNMDKIFTNFKLLKDFRYQKECDDKLFASYICVPI